MVVVASLAVLTLVLATLSITAASRNITSRYENFFGLYDIAVAGNEQALFSLQDGNVPTQQQRDEWEFEINIAGEIHRYTASTTVTPQGGSEFQVQTNIAKYEGNALSTVARVRSRIFLDGTTYKMVELLRIAD